REPGPTVWKRQERRRTLPREAFVGHAGPRLGEPHLADPRGLPVVVAQRLARLLGEDAAFGDHRDVEALGDAAVELDALRDRLQRADRGAEAAREALRLAGARLHPRLLQRRDDGAVWQHRAEH